MGHVNSVLDGKVILVTGGTGSFGNAFARVVLREHQPSALRIYSRDELKQLEMEQRLQDDRLRFLIGDVRDKDRLFRAMEGVDIVIHAAALKQVPSAEYNPIEAVKTNIMGAVNVIDAAIDARVPRILFISTDKAVHPVNLYGATKLVAERLFVQANAYAGARDIRFACARYGNVVGSRGSVIPRFLAERQNSYLSITDERMTRFWITLDQGVRFVVDCLGRMQGGEIFVPKIPSMRLVHVARTLAPEAEWKIIGIRPGEKIHEELITPEEAPLTLEFDTYYVIQPPFQFGKTRCQEGCQPVGDDFHYRSDTNTWWLEPEQLMEYVRLLGDDH